MLSQRLPVSDTAPNLRDPRFVLYNAGMNSHDAVHRGASQTEQRDEAAVADLVRRAQGGEERAFGEIYEAYFDRVYRYVIYRIQNAADAEDLAEDVFLRMLESIQSFKWRDVPFAAWIMRIAHNRVVDYWRRDRHRSGIPIDDAPPLPSRDDDPHRRIELVSDVQELQQAMETLTDLQREVLSFRFGAGLSVAETAKAMKRKDGAVKALQHSAVAALRRNMPPISESSDL
jgi:RNA polymerase sigma-70 factor (ECF subfamily)